MDKITIVFYYLSCYSVLLPLAFWIERRAKAYDPLFKVIGFLLLVSGLSDAFFYYMDKIGRDADIISNIYTVLEFTLVSLLFSYLCPPIKKLIYRLGVGYFIFFIITCVYIQNIRVFQNIPLIVSSLVFITYSITYYFYLIKDFPTDNVLTYSSFWLVFAILFYFGFDMYIFALDSYVTKLPRADAKLVWMFHNLGNTCKNLLFAIGIYFYGRPVKKPVLHSR